MNSPTVPHVYTNINLIQLNPRILKCGPASTLGARMRKTNKQCMTTSKTPAQGSRPQKKHPKSGCWLMIIILRRLDEDRWLGQCVACSLWTINSQTQRLSAAGLPCGRTGTEWRQQAAHSRIHNPRTTFCPLTHTHTAYTMSYTT